MMDCGLGLVVSLSGRDPDEQVQAPNSQRRRDSIKAFGYVYGVERLGDNLIKHFMLTQ